MWRWEWEEGRGERGEKYIPNRWKRQMKILVECLSAKSQSNALTEARSKLHINSIDFLEYNNESEVLQNASVIITFGCVFNSYSSEQPWLPSRPCGHPNCKLMLLNCSVVTVQCKGAARASGEAVTAEALSFPFPAVADSRKGLFPAPSLESQ